jgi:pimeloyl-ACP methyl ester carboxylesterase
MATGRHAKRIERLVAMSAPHPAVWVEAIRTVPEQRKKSWYVKAFQIPWLPEFLIRQRNYKALADALREGKRPQACTDEDLARYREAWSQPGALTAMINWYRAKRDFAQVPQRIPFPTLIVWGDGDRYGVPALADRCALLCDHGSVIHLDASHWVQHDVPEKINALLLDFLKG